MKPNQYIPIIILLLCVLATPARSQNRHFPANHHILCGGEKDGTFQVLQMQYDSNSTTEEPFQL